MIQTKNNSYMFRLILSLISVLFIVCNSLASNEFVTKKYTTLDGLSQNDVQCIYQDSKGFIWLATNDGLNRFDGYEFKVYGYQSNGLTSNLIVSIDEDSHGNLWIGTADRGVFLFNSVKNEFISLNIGHIGIDKNFTCDKILVDSKDRVWFHSSDESIYLVNYDFSNGKINTVLKSTIKLPYISDIIEIDNTIMLSSEGGLYECSVHREKLQLNKLLDSPIAAAIVISSSQILYSNLENHQLCLYDKHTCKVSTLLENCNIRKMVYKNKRLFYATTSTVSVLPFDVLHAIESKPQVIATYSYSYPQTIVLDKNDILWIGFFKSGFMSIRENNKPIELFREIGNDHVSSIYTFAKSDIYLGTEGSGLYHFNSITGNARLIPFTANRIVYSTTYSNFTDRMYVSLMYDGIYSFTSDNDYKKISGLRNVRTMLADGKYLWVGTYNKGLFRYDLSTGVMKEIKTLENKELKIVRNVVKDHKGNLWVASSYGLKVLKSADLYLDNPVLNSVKGLDELDYIVPICEDLNHNIWYGTLGRGLKKIVDLDDSLNVRIEDFSTANGLNSNTIKSIVNGTDGTLWISTNKGINSLNINTQKIKSYDIYDGLQDYEFMELSAGVMTDGTMIFGGVNGINVFRPNDFDVMDFNGCPTLVDFKIFNHSVEADSIYSVYFDKSVCFTEYIELPYNLNTFSFQFSSLDYRSPYKVVYEYMLEGVDNSWISTSAFHREAFYTKLSSGEYMFRLRVRNTDGVYSSNELSIPVIITPPFWRTWYAYTFYLMLLALSLYQFKRYYTSRAQRRNAVYIANMEKRKTEELLEKETTFFTNISHELRTPLTLIHSPLSMIIESGKYSSDKYLVGMLQTMEHNSKFLLRLVNKLMNFSKSEKGMLSLNLRYGNFSSFSKEVFQQFTYWSKQKGVGLEYSVSRSDISFLFDSHLMEQIIYNLVSNAIKHTPAGGFVSFTVNEQDNKINIAIADSGNGISEDLKTHLFERFYSQNKNSAEGGTGIGLFLTKRLVEIHNGNISFVSEEGKGTVFHVQIPMITEREMMTENLFSNNRNDEEFIDVLSSKSSESEDIENTQVKGESPVVLIVDDNKDICNMLSLLLSDKYKIMIAYDGEMAWNMIPDMQPDLVLSDIMMPGMNGLELCERIKQDVRTSHIPVVLLSAKTTLQDYLIGYKFHADAYCPKPFDNQIMKELLNSIITNRKRILQHKKVSTIKISEVTTTSTDDKFLEKLVKIIEDNIADSSFQIEDICKGLGVTALVLNKKLKTLMGITANAFVRSIRMKRAAELLKTGRYSVSEVTYDVGFNDLKYFRECFKKEFGVLPQQYKEQNTQTDLDS